MPLTIKDFQKIQQLFGNEFESRMFKIFAYIDKSQFQLKTEFEDKIKHLPTKEEFYNREDQIMGELKSIREELEMLGYRVSQHSDQISALESLHPHGKHLPA